MHDVEQRPGRNQDNHDDDIGPHDGGEMNAESSANGLLVNMDAPLLLR